MNAEEFGTVTKGIAAAIVDGSPGIVLETLKDVYIELDQHRQQMEAAERKPVTAGQIRDAELSTPTTEIGKAQATPELETMFGGVLRGSGLAPDVDYSGRLDAIEKRLDGEHGIGERVSNLDQAAVTAHTRLGAHVGRFETIEKRLGEIERKAIVVEMQLIPPPWNNAGWTWITQLAGLHLHGSQDWPCAYFEHDDDAIENGTTWLAALSEKCGIKFVPKWLTRGRVVGKP